MAKAIICDRCKGIQEPSKGGRVDIPFVRDISEMHLYKGTNQDLCESCHVSLSFWWHNPNAYSVQERLNEKIKEIESHGARGTCSTAVLHELIGIRDAK